MARPFERGAEGARSQRAVTVIHVARPCEGIKSVAFADLAATAVTKDVETSIANIAPDTIGKLLFTSGLDRDAQGGHQHATDDVRQCRDDDAGSAARSERAGRRRISTGCRGNHTMGGNALFNPGADRRRHALYRTMAGR